MEGDSRVFHGLPVPVQPGRLIYKTLSSLAYPRYSPVISQSRRAGWKHLRKKFTERCTGSLFIFHRFQEPSQRSQGAPVNSCITPGRCPCPSSPHSLEQTTPRSPPHSAPLTLMLSDGANTAHAVLRASPGTAGRAGGIRVVGTQWAR